jgi:hypothetical protein
VITSPIGAKLKSEIKNWNFKKWNGSIVFM